LEDVIQKWYLAQDLGLSGRLAEECSEYIKRINQNAITLSKKPDLLVWTWNNSDGMVKVKEAYHALIAQTMEDEVRWWHTIIWKVKAPVKIIMFMWLCLKNRVLNRLRGRLRGGIGPSICHLCLINEESIQHLVVDCGTS